MDFIKVGDLFYGGQFGLGYVSKIDDYYVHYRFFNEISEHRMAYLLDFESFFSLESWKQSFEPWKHIPVLT